MPPTPSARSSEMLPEEMAEMSCTRGSSLPRRMTAPLPNCFSMAETASSIAFSFSGFATRSLRWGLLYACTEARHGAQDGRGVRQRPSREGLLPFDPEELDLEDQRGAARDR